MWFTILCISGTAAQNNTTIATTEDPLGFLYYSTLSFYNDTKEPTVAPQTAAPTRTPTEYPTTSLNSGNAFEVVCTFTMDGFTLTEAQLSSALFELAIRSIFALPDAATVIVLSVTENSEGYIVVTLQIATEDPLVFAIVEDATRSGKSAAFETAYILQIEKGLPSATLISFTQDSAGQRDRDDIYNTKFATFGELFATWYLFLGLVMIFVGSVWLLFLRLPVKNNFASLPMTTTKVQSGSGPQAGTNVELVQSAN